MRVTFKLPPELELDGIRTVKVSKEYLLEDANNEELINEIDNLDAQGYIINVVLKVTLPKDDEEK